MEALANILSIAGALGAAFYCFTLSGRLRRFNRTEDGMRGAVAALSAQVDGMTRALRTAREAAADPALRLDALIRRAEEAAGRLELMLAALNDLPAEEAGPPAARRVLRRRRPAPPAGPAPGAATHDGAPDDAAAEAAASRTAGPEVVAA
ncbi:MAG: hypothetical protein N2422_09960 [Rhodobacteraceae bacterium]|nr:hypothetical protein [Paracoccaceae bacterium]